LIVKLPRSAAGPPPGTSLAGPVALLDVLPTVLELTGAAWEGPLRGMPLLGPGARAHPLVSETARLGGAQSLVSGDYKLIRRLRSGERELYDLVRDPREQRDLSATHPAELERLAAELAAWERATLARASGEVELTDPELEELRELGYAGADEER
jgi:arylsulfatase A-like enzyme